MKNYRKIDLKNTEKNSDMILYQVDAFTSKLFSGNPAAVIPLPEWIDEQLMQQLAMENNLSETVFFVPSSHKGADYDIRWFTPEAEINLCGHATLASSYVLFEILQHAGEKLVFHSKSGLLTIIKQGDKYVMDFPSWKPVRQDVVPELLQQVLGDAEILGLYKSRDFLVELCDEEAVRKCAPDFTLMKKHFDKVIITAPGRDADFVSRFFAPAFGVDEDPVTGSAHSQLIPFWSDKLGKHELFARQLSRRGGEIWCSQLSSERVTMAGQCVFYMKGELAL
jgi:PhzF family phenazine biosynthesis protein